MEYNHDATTTAKYFADLIQEKPIRFGYAEGKGKALFAAKRLLPGQPIFSEMPFVAMQHLSNQVRGEFTLCEPSAMTRVLYKDVKTAMLCVDRSNRSWHTSCTWKAVQSHLSPEL
ncbi:unnamed protein product [Aphanomyces euteiches]